MVCTRDANTSESQHLVRIYGGPGFLDVCPSSSLRPAGMPSLGQAGLRPFPGSAWTAGCLTCRRPAPRWEISFGTHHSSPWRMDTEFKIGKAPWQVCHLDYRRSALSLASGGPEPHAVAQCGHTEPGPTPTTLGYCRIRSRILR